jgi:hypothetical protein
MLLGLFVTKTNFKGLFLIKGGLISGILGY